MGEVDLHCVCVRALLPLSLLLRYFLQGSVCCTIFFVSISARCLVIASVSDDLRVVDDVFTVAFSVFVAPVGYRM